MGENGEAVGGIGRPAVLVTIVDLLLTTVFRVNRVAAFSSGDVVPQAGDPARHLLGLLPELGRPQDVQQRSQAAGSDQQQQTGYWATDLCR